MYTDDYNYQDPYEVYQEHCGPGGFSPAAPPEFCNQFNQVPEPPSFLLFATALCMALVVRKLRRA